MADPRLLENRLAMLADYLAYDVSVRVLDKNVAEDKRRATLLELSQDYLLAEPVEVLHSDGYGHYPVEMVLLELYTLDQLPYILPDQGALAHLVQNCVPLASEGGPYGEWPNGQFTVTGGPHQIIISFDTFYLPDRGDDPDDAYDSDEYGTYGRYDLLISNNGELLYRSNLTDSEEKGPWQPAKGGLYVYQYLRSLHVAVGSVFPPYHAEPKFFVRKELQKGGPDNG